MCGGGCIKVMNGFGGNKINPHFFREGTVFPYFGKGAVVLSNDGGELTFVSLGDVLNFVEITKANFDKYSEEETAFYDVDTKVVKDSGLANKVAEALI